MFTYPLMLDLAGRRVVVVGAGAVATRKIAALIAAEASVVVVSPVATPEISALASDNALQLIDRAFAAPDINDAWFVIAATDDLAVNAAVANACESQRVWCVNASDHHAGSAANLTSGQLENGAIAAVFGGGDPGRAKAILDLMTLLNETENLPTTATRTTQPRSVGRVALVGTGPGDPTLLTLRAIEAVRQADVLVVDRLAPAALWERAGNTAEVIDVGKAPGKHAASQDEINAILVEKALAGKVVARLKGGDPFVLGRGGEEAAACIAAGILVEVIPGITSAISVPAAAGIPVTQRGLTSTFIVASAHEGPAGVLRAVADAPHSSTLVLLMGAGALPAISTALVDTGRSPETPVAVIESGWTPKQYVTVTSLGESAAGAVRVQPPAVVVIGEVVRLRDQLGELGVASAISGHA